MGVASGCGEQEVGVGGIYGCGCKEVYRFPHTTYLVSVLFCSIPTFCSFLNVFRSCSSTFLNYILCINPFTGNVALLHHARPLERATSLYCTTGIPQVAAVCLRRIRGLFTTHS